MDFSYLYISRPQTSVDDDHARIAETFRELVEKGKTGIKLLTYYQGLPLCFPAQIVAVEHGMLDLDVHTQQAVALEKELFTFIRCDAFANDIGAHVQNINVDRCAATLTKFFFVEVMADYRQAIRLMLDPPTEASFSLDNAKVKGKLVDLSIGGAAIVVEGVPEHANGFETSLQFLLPNIIQNTHVIVDVPALHVETTELGGSRLCRFSITPDKTVEHNISQYIFQRQVEIIRYLKGEAR